jgi:hypothetical protein
LVTRPLEGELATSVPLGPVFGAGPPGGSVHLGLAVGRESARVEAGLGCAEPQRASVPATGRSRGYTATRFPTRAEHGLLLLQYWLYYPDSNTTVLGSDKLWEAVWLIPKLRGLVARTPGYPGYHRDDWEGYVVRLEPDGSASVRASSHGHWQGCKERDCRGEWTGRTGWTRVSRGSHAGHIPLGGERRQVPLLPGRDLDERTTTSEGLTLIPLETHDRRRYRPHAQGVRPPWRKRAYHEPESDES